jgi:mono/diheme cytochrome c family protein
MRVVPVVMVAGLGVLMAGRLAAAAPGPSPEAGGELAARWCAACHVVSVSGAGGSSAPSFGAIAQHRAAADIRAALSRPHARPMRGFTLKRHEVDDVTAYIESLDSRR